MVMGLNPGYLLKSFLLYARREPLAFVWSIITIGPYLKLIIQDFPFSSRVASIGFLWTKMIWQCENHGTNFVIKIQKFALKQQKWLTHYLMSKVSHSIYIRTFKILQLQSQIKFTLTQTDKAVKKIELVKVRIFWEAHIIWKNLPYGFDVY